MTEHFHSPVYIWIYVGQDCHYKFKLPSVFCLFLFELPGVMRSFKVVLCWSGERLKVTCGDKSSTLSSTPSGRAESSQLACFSLKCL